MLFYFVPKGRVKEMKSGIHMKEYQALSQFSSLKEFNESINLFVKEKGSLFTKSELVAFNRLTKFAVKIKGVAFAKVCTIVSATYKEGDMGGISRSTFERMLRKAKKTGILTIISTSRKTTGGKGHSVYVFNPYLSDSYLEENGKNTDEGSNDITIEVVDNEQLKEPEQPEAVDTPEVQPEKSEPKPLGFKPLSLKDLKNVGKPYIYDSVDKKFSSFVSSFLSDPVEVYELWKNVKSCSKQYEHVVDRDTVIDTAVESFKQLVARMKLTSMKPINNPVGYFTGIYKKKIKGRYALKLTESMFDF
jgi:hypothetical protein